MEKIAIPSDGGQFAQHFGRSPEYTFFEVEEGEIINKSTVSNPGHQPGYLPNFLAEQDVDCVICSGMGRKAQDLFARRGIDVVIGVSGDMNEKVRAYIDDDLETGENICSH